MPYGNVYAVGCGFFELVGVFHCPVPKVPSQVCLKDLVKALCGGRALGLEQRVVGVRRAEPGKQHAGIISVKANPGERKTTVGAGADTTVLPALWCRKS